MKRDDFTLSLDLGHELIVDNFAGGGGASTALALALGREPDIAINHNGEALCMHAANHPTTKHYREDVFLIHPGFVTKQQPIGVAWFSPTCTHFSKAKGGNLLSQKMRGLAWVTLKWAVMQMPRIMFLENVEEFQGWGPLDAAGKPIKAHKGRTFSAFVLALTTGIPKDHPDLTEIHETLGGDFPIARLFTGLGYKVEWQVLRACDFGAPTIRKRLFMVMRRDGRAIVWPSPTHGKRDSADVKSGKLKPFMSAADCIDWSIPCPSIFTRKKELAPATLRRVGKGYEKYVKDAASPYIVQTGYGERAGQAPRVLDLAEPLGTVVAGGGKHALVAPLFLPLTHQGSDRTSAPDEPLPTVTCANRGEMAMAAVSLVQYYSNGSQNRSVDDPMPTVVTKDRIGVTCAYLAKHYQGVVGASVEAPMPTVTTVDHNSLITAHLIGIDNQTSGDGAAWDVASPLNTIVTENRHALVTVHIQRDMGRSIGHDALEPLATITAGGGGKAALVTSNLVKLRGTSNAASTGEPMGTASAGGTHHAEVRTTIAREPESHQRREQVRAFLREFCPSLKDAERPELVTIHGELMEVVDIGLRMLAPRELANAQGFPRDYILDPFYTSVNKRGKTVTKRLSGSAQVRMIGNSVSPPPAIALIKANCSHELAMARAA